MIATRATTPTTDPTATNTADDDDEASVEPVWAEEPAPSESLAAPQLLVLVQRYGAVVVGQRMPSPGFHERALPPTGWSC